MTARPEEASSPKAPDKTALARTSAPRTCVCQKPEGRT